MKIALVHDYLNEAGGAERVLRVLSEMYPEAPIYTAFTKNGTAKQIFTGKQIIESKWAPLLKIGRMYSYLRFLLPLIWKSMDLTVYDVVITSCSGYIARGFRVGERTKLIAYCHTPPRWLYGYETPTSADKAWWGKVFLWVFGPYVRYFDYQSAQRVNIWIANSQEVAKRIQKFYREEATVVYPPINISKSANPSTNSGLGQRISIKSGYYLLVSRIVGGKGIEEAIRGVESEGVKLIIVGEMVGALAHSLRLIAHSKNVEYLGRVSDRQLSQLYAQAKGFIALAKDEDFGMTVVEAMSYGTPVLCYYGGGYKETVIPRLNGVFVNKTDARSVAEGIRKMEAVKWEKEKIINSVKKFATKIFEKEIREVVGK